MKNNTKMKIKTSINHVGLAVKQGSPLDEFQGFFFGVVVDNPHEPLLLSLVFACAGILHVLRDYLIAVGEPFDLRTTIKLLISRLYLIHCIPWHCSPPMQSLNDLPHVGVLTQSSHELGVEELAQVGLPSLALQNGLVLGDLVSGVLVLDPLLKLN